MILREHLRLRGYYKVIKKGTIVAVPHVAPCDLAVCIVFLLKSSQRYLKDLLTRFFYKRLYNTTPIFSCTLNENGLLKRSPF